MKKIATFIVIALSILSLCATPLFINAQNCSYALNLKDRSTYDWGELSNTTISQATPDHWEVKGTNNGPGLGYLEPVFDFSSCIVNEIYTGFYVNRTGTMLPGDYVSLQVMTDVHTTWTDFLKLDDVYFNNQTSNISFHTVVIQPSDYIDPSEVRIRMYVRSSSNGTPIKIKDGELVISTTPLLSLPLDLVSFSAELENEREVALTWTTENEENVSHFEVQYSRDGENWEEVDFLHANNFMTTNTYETSHIPTNSGTHYYRLKMEDLDGSFVYSDVVSAKTAQSIELEVFPIPARDHLTVNSNIENATLTIMDAMGRVLIQQEMSNSNETIDIDHLPNGHYFLRVQDEVSVETRTIVKAN